MTDAPATPADAAAEKISFDDLYWRIESDRINAETWRDVCLQDHRDAVAKGDAVLAATCLSGWRGNKRRAEHYERLQTLIDRIGKSATIKAELTRLALLEKAATERSAREIGDEGGAVT